MKLQRLLTPWSLPVAPGITPPPPLTQAVRLQLLHPWRLCVRTAEGMNCRDLTLAEVMAAYERIEARKGGQSA